MEKRRGRPRDESVEWKISAAVIDLLESRGYAGTTIEQVALVTGLSRPTIYRRHANKTLMINAVIGQLLDQSADSLVEVVDPLQNVRNHLINTIALLNETPVGPIYRAVIAEIPRNPDLAKLVGKIGSARRVRLNKAVERAQHAGCLSFPGDTKIALDGIVGAIYFRYLTTPHLLSKAYADELLAPAITISH
ncbi:MAG: TetR/AcrR family transcriptional regulator [Pseudomonadota bacterium]